MKSVSAHSSSRHQRALPCRRSRILPARARSRLRLLSSSSLADEERVCSLVVQTSAGAPLPTLAGVSRSRSVAPEAAVFLLARREERVCSLVVQTSAGAPLPTLAGVSRSRSVAPEAAVFLLARREERVCSLVVQTSAGAPLPTLAGV